MIFTFNMLKDLLSKLKKAGKINTGSPYYYLGVLAVALLIFGFSFYQAQSNIRNPFVIGAARFANVENADTEEIDLEDVEALKKLDTDKDGLSDYLELYVYGTSAYIEDTDSDGLSDSIEVVSGGDPLCGNPDGCKSSVFGSPPSNETNSGTQFDGDEEALRKTLIDMGFTAGDLSVLSMNDLQELYTQTNVVLSGGVQKDSELVLDEDYYDLSVDEIRTLLLSGGVTEDEIATISDEKLLELYQEALLEGQ